MRRPNLYSALKAGSVMDDWDRIPWSDFPGEPTVFVPSDPQYTNRQHKFIFDALYDANLNVSLGEDENTKRLITTPLPYLQDKFQLGELTEEFGLPTLRQHIFDRDYVASINYPILLKPRTGKNSMDRSVPISYKVFQNGNALLGALNNITLPWDESVLSKTHFVQESAAQANGDVDKILGMVLINGNGEYRVAHVDEQSWTPRTQSNNLDLAIRRPEVTTHHAYCGQVTQAFINEFGNDKLGLKNCCLYIQAIIKDGVYYYTDADICIPKVYAVALRHHLPEHLRFMFDAAHEITIPQEYVVTKTLVHLRGSVDTHLDLLESRVIDFDGFYWIQRKDVNPADEFGRYMLITSGMTEAEAINKMNNWVEYLTVE